MSNDTNGTHDDHEAFADAFGRTTDPLAQYEGTFRSIEKDPFDTFLNDAVYSQDYENGTVGEYETRIKQWRRYLEGECDRHPACASSKHAIDFYHHLVDERGNQTDTARRKLQFIERVYHYFAGSASLPHSTDYNPLNEALGKIPKGTTEVKDPRPIPKHEIREFVKREIKQIQDRAIVMAGFKWGLRAREVTNIKIADINLTKEAVQDHYPDMGTADPLEGRPNAIYIPHTREGNKSKCPRVLPIDDEMRRVLVQWLLTRPDDGEPYLFLSPTSGKQWQPTSINESVWVKHFRPKYGPTDRFRGVSSHYGRHFFTTYFEQDREWKSTFVDYMRGDQMGEGEIGPRRTAIESYVHAHYEDIESRYRHEVFNFRV